MKNNLKKEKLNIRLTSKEKRMILKNVESVDMTISDYARMALLLLDSKTGTLFDTARSCLTQIKQQQEADRAFFGKEYANEEGYIFTWEDGHTYDPNYISRLFTKAMTEFGRPEITVVQQIR